MKTGGRGDILGGYRLVRRLAAGGMAEVFLAEPLEAGPGPAQVCIKRILPHLSSDPAFVRMFRTEVALASRLHHPNVARVYESGEDGGVQYLVMEFIDGVTLRALLRGARTAKTQLPLPLAAKLAALSCEGLAYAHALTEPENGRPLNLVHRDVSPENILLSRSGAVKVVDFGIAKAEGQASTTRAGELKGKFAYMSPEQLSGQPLDRRSDVFALGMVLYELCTGRKPYEAGSDAATIQAVLHAPFDKASAHRPEVPAALQQVLDRALARDRAQRYPDCRTFGAELGRWLSQCGEQVTARELGAWAEQAAVSPPPRPASPGTVGARPSGLPTDVHTQPETTEPDAGSPTHHTRALGASDSQPAHAPIHAIDWSAPTQLQPRERIPVADTVAQTAFSPMVPPPPAAPAAKPGPGPKPRRTGAPPLDPRHAAVALAAVTLVAATVWLLRGEQPEPLPANPTPPTETAAARAPDGKAVVEFLLHPAGTVSVDGEPLGMTPFPARELPPGAHRVRCTDPASGRTAAFNVELKPGPNTVRFDFDTAVH